VPVSCDYLSLVGVKQVLRTLKNVRELSQARGRDPRRAPDLLRLARKIARDSHRGAARPLRGSLPPARPREHQAQAEAPERASKTIFEHAPDSHGAEDYRALVEHVRRVRGDASLLDRESASSSAVGLRADLDALSASPAVAVEAAMAG
jgi:chromosome partitioning protein